MRTLSVGIGCRLHSSAEQIEAAVRAALGSHAFEAIGTVASIETKVREAGLLEFCARHALPLTFFSREQIAAIPAGQPSAAANEHLGVDGVCEPCALLAATGASAASSAPSAPSAAPAAPAASEPHDPPAAPHARLLVPKIVHAGVTVAIATATAYGGNEPTSNDTQQQDLP